MKNILKTGLDYAKDKVKEFHIAFGHPHTDKPTAMNLDTAISRTVWTAEELVEFLFASTGGDKKEFKKAIGKLYAGIEKAKEKTLKQPDQVENVLVSQSDALIDSFYFLLGSAVVMGIDLQPLFDIVQRANMGKLWEDGKPHFDVNNGGKIMKPEGWQEKFAPEPLLKAEIERQIKASVKAS